MTEKDLDIAIEKCERIMEFDTRTMKNSESENGYIFEKVYDLLRFLRELQFSTGAKGGGDPIERQEALDAIDANNGILYDNPTLVASLHKLLSELPSATETNVGGNLKYDEWCDDCKEYDQERHCCPRWNRVIRQTVDDVKKEWKSCNGCKHMGNDFKCNRCVRAAQDNYEPWEGGQE